jgi:predicted nucleic-acid-binding protein
MKGLDTNVLLRFFVDDDPPQAERVAALFEAAEKAGERLFISTIVLCELIWTLSGRRYGLDRGEIAAVLDRILSVQLFQMQDQTLVRRSLDDFLHGEADFADYLLGRYALAAGCSETLTFDRSLAGAARFLLLA